MFFNRKIIFSACIIFSVSLAIASSEDTQQPITIEADRAVLDEKKQTSTYTGNVILKQGDIEVRADTITVYSREGRLQRVIAEGDPVHYKQQQQKDDDIRGVSQRMEYEAESNRVLLLGGAELWQGGNRFSGERIQYDPEQEKVIATGGLNSTKRVQIILQPQSSKAGSSDQKNQQSLKQQKQQQENP